MDKILEFFIKEPERKFHVRELARELKKSPTTISKKLNKLKGKKLLLSEKKLNHHLFYSNSESRKFKLQKLNYNLNLIEESSLLNFLEEYYNHPQAIVLFGSFAKAENSKNSDLDILIITSKKEQPSLKKFEKIIKNEIQLFTHSESELIKLKKTNKELVNNWINGINLRGYFQILK